MKAAPARLRLSVQVTPNASRSEVAGVTEGVLRIRLRAAPIDGKANEALIRFLADALSLPKSAVSIATGHAGRRKTVEIAGSAMTGEQMLARLGVQSR